MTSQHAQELEPAVICRQPHPHPVTDTGRDLHADLTAGLDPAGVDEMLAALATIEAHGTTVVLSTHDVDLAWAWADEVLLVADHVVHQGSLVDALTDEPLLAAATARDAA